VDFEIKTRAKELVKDYKKEDMDIVYEFSKQAKKECKDLIKAIILFGSTARKVHEGDLKGRSKDIDVLIIIDDINIELSQEIIQTYRIIIEKIVAKTSKRLHITTLRFTNFWEYARAGDPIAINMLRDGIAILDTGFFDPLQILLYQGRIRPSAEAIQNYLALAPQTLQNSKNHILQAVLDLYWAVIDSAHAALMYVNETPPSPAHVSELMDEKLVKPGILDKRYMHTMRNFYSLGKSIMHGEITQISGDQYDMYYREAHDFVMAIKKFIEKR
jgi:uncharacterized protein (UPF0332 family)/predicted nucleotidyltransferase